MKKVLLLVGLALVQWLSFELQAQCNHRVGFGRSAVADSVDALHYKIHINAIDFTAKSIQAVAEITLRPKVSLQHIPLELKALQVSSVILNNQSLSFAQQGDILRINTGQVYTSNDTLLITIVYSGIPFHEGWGGFHFSGNYAFNLGVGFESDPHNLGKAWFPCVDDFQDRATYEVFITLPNAMTGIAGGILTDTIHHNNNTTTWHWSLNQEIPTYLASVNAGNYVLKEYSFQGMNGALPITIYTRPSDTNKVDGSFIHLQQILSIFEAKFGPYPFDRVGYTGTAIGAMEHVTNVAYPHSAINGNLSSEYLFTHELSHMWFGNLVTCADAGDMWLNEGWATFCQYYFKHDLYGPEVYRNEMNANHLDVLRNAHITDGSYLSLHDVPTQYTYGTTVYDKGGTVVHSLMNYIGPELFFNAVKAYLQQFAFQHASSYDLRNFLSNYTGQNLTGFFDNWVFTPGTPHYSIDSMQTIPIPEGHFKTHLYVKQKHKGYQFVGVDNRFEVTFMALDGQRFTDTIEFSGKTGHSVKILPFEPVLAMADFYDKTADATTDVDGILRGTGETTFTSINFKLFVDVLPDTAFYRFTHHWVAPDSLRQPFAGLRLSPYRHWEMKGIFPQGTTMRGRFFYNKSSTLDGSLIQSEQDSVVVLYRPDAAHEWQSVPQTREGMWNVGYIFVDDFQPGQYTLAVWDTQLVNLIEKPYLLEDSQLKVEPNPVSEQMTILWEKQTTGKLSVVESSGKTIYAQKLLRQNSFKINTHSWAKGWYFILLEDQNNKVIGHSKVLVH